MNCKGCPPSTLPHSLMIKTYCLPTRVSSTNSIQQKQWYSTYVMQFLKMLNVTN